MAAREGWRAHLQRSLNLGHERGSSSGAAGIAALAAAALKDAEQRAGEALPVQHSLAPGEVAAALPNANTPSRPRIKSYRRPRSKRRRGTAWGELRSHAAWSHAAAGQQKRAWMG